MLSWRLIWTLVLIEKEKSRTKRNRDQFAGIEDQEAGETSDNAAHTGNLQSKVLRAESSGTSQIIQPPPVPESLLSTPPPRHSSLESCAQSEHQDPSQCQTPRSSLSAGGSMAPTSQNDVPLCGSILSSTRQQKCNKQGHCALHNAYDSKNSVGSIVLCNKLTRYLMNNDC